MVKSQQFSLHFRVIFKKSWPSHKKRILTCEMPAAGAEILGVFYKNKKGPVIGSQPHLKKKTLQHMAAIF